MFKNTKINKYIHERIKVNFEFQLGSWADDISGFKVPYKLGGSEAPNSSLSL